MTEIMEPAKLEEGMQEEQNQSAQETYSHAAQSRSFRRAPFLL